MVAEDQAARTEECRSVQFPLHTVLPVKKNDERLGGSYFDSKYFLRRLYTWSLVSNISNSGRPCTSR